MTAGLRVSVLRHPFTRRVVGYSAGSIVAAIIGELVFAAMFGLFRAGTTWATAAGFIGAAVPNYILNRRWAWPDRQGRTRRAEVTLYLVVVACSFAASALVTHWVEGAAVHISPDRAWQTVLVATAFLAVSGLFFVIKFALYEWVVFSPTVVPSSQPTPEPSAVEASGAVAPGG